AAVPGPVDLDAVPRVGRVGLVDPAEVLELHHPGGRPALQGVVDDQLAGVPRQDDAHGGGPDVGVPLRPGADAEVGPAVHVAGELEPERDRVAALGAGALVDDPLGGQVADDALVQAEAAVVSGDRRKLKGRAGPAAGDDVGRLARRGGNAADAGG